MPLPVLSLADVALLARDNSLVLRFPQTTTAGYNTARTDGYVRVDLRVDKRAVWRSWLLDFYVDIANVALLPEEVTAGTTIRYVLPTSPDGPHRPFCQLRKDHLHADQGGVAAAGEMLAGEQAPAPQPGVDPCQGQW